MISQNGQTHFRNIAARFLKLVNHFETKYFKGLKFKWKFGYHFKIFTRKAS